MTTTTLRRLFSIAMLFLTALASAGITSAQLNQVDPTFNAVPSNKFGDDDALGKGLLVQPDGKVVIWRGNFAVDGLAKGEIVRLNVDGTVDNTYTYCNCVPVGEVGIQQDGKLLVASNAFGH